MMNRPDTNTLLVQQARRLVEATAEAICAANQSVNILDVEAHLYGLLAATCEKQRAMRISARRAHLNIVEPAQGGTQ